MAVCECIQRSNARATGWGSTWSSTLTMTFSLTLCTRTSCDVLWREKFPAASGPWRRSSQHSEERPRVAQ
jgi:hypothetical protein